jgi:hypothetical protein
MARALLRIGSDSRKVVLTPTTLFGRHWSCHIRIDDPRVPLYWVEVRWQDGAWTWRSLAGPERTRGTGTAIQGGWRVWPPNRATVRLDDFLLLQLTDPSAPGLVLEEPFSGQRIEEQDALELLELGKDGVRPLGRPDDIFIGDGGQIELNGQTWRVWLPRLWRTQHTVNLDLRARGLRLDLAGSPTVATFTQASKSIELRGVGALLLKAYAQRRLEEPLAEGGWMSTSELLAAWNSLASTTSDNLNRIAWERGKIRSQLVQDGATHPESLFERRRDGSKWMVRLGLASDAIKIEEP